MPLYDFRCPEGDVFEASFMMQEKPDTIACPTCGKDAASLMPAIGPSNPNSPNMKVLDATKATAEHPEVVNSIAGARTTRWPPTATSTNPLHQKLPKP